MTAPAFRTAERRARGMRPPLPTLRAVLREQIRATGLVLRRPALIAVALLALVTLVSTLQSVSLGPVVDLYEWPTFLPGLIGALLPIAVWPRDERFGPGFLWTLPVDRRRHALTKVVAGWVWVMGVVVLFSLWLGALALVSNSRVVPPETLRVLTSELPATGPLDPAALRTASWSPGPMIWAIPFTAATAVYLLASALMLGTRHPLRWVIGIVLSYAVVSVGSDAAGAQLGVGWLVDAPSRLVHLIVESRYGLDALLSGRTETLSTTTFLTTGERVMVWRGVPDLAHCRTATLLWTGVGLFVLWAAVSRHREQRRG